MISAILVEDEPAGLVNLISMLEKHCPQVEIIGTATNNAEFIKLIEEKDLHPDVAFLDINLPDGMVFNALDALESIDFEIVFVTAFNEYTMRAFDVAAIDYILKPYEPDNLMRAVSRIRTAPKRTYSNEQFLEAAREATSINPNAIEKIGISAIDGLHFVRLADIACLQSDNNYTKIIMKSNDKITASQTLKVFDKMLTPMNFMRTHQSHLININCIKTYIRGEGGTIILDNNREVPVSRRFKSSVLKTLRNIQS